MKIVRENLNEFRREGNALDNLGIGPIFLKKQIKEWLDQHRLFQCIINDDLTINSDLSVNLSPSIFVKGRGNFPDFINFGTIYGYFCIEKREMDSLRGCPKTVYGTFDCRNNKLKNLVGGPEEVYGLYLCSSNELDSYDGFPKKVLRESQDFYSRGNFICYHNRGMKLDKKIISKISKIEDEILV